MTIYVSVRHMQTGRGGIISGLWGSNGAPRWDDIPIGVPDKSGASFDFARRQAKREISEENKIPYKQLRVVGAF